MIPAFCWLGTALRALDQNAKLEAGEANEMASISGPSPVMRPTQCSSRQDVDKAARPYLLPQEVAAPNVPARSPGINQPTKRPPPQWALFQDLRK